MNKLNLATLLFTCLSFFPLFSQQLDRIQGEVLVMFESETDVRAWAVQFNTFKGEKSDFKVNGIVSKPMNIWSFTFDHNTINEYNILNAIKRTPEVKLAQFNHLIQMRSTVPNDTQFNDQWQYINTGQGGGLPGADIDADLAWDITTGGLTAFGDTIVVCVIDGGIDLTHQDFEDNLWINYQEIPNNDIDDDGNGYVDDYRGWNPTAGNDDIAGSSHGTSVAGIIGAKGNNGIGVTGVSWNVKVMVIRNGSTAESNVLAAYTYPLIQRRLYNETNGQKGAFVVATNASWGVNFGQPEDAPLWCAMYDTLGQEGILNCGATANLEVNVDEMGDLPTSCTSDFLIAVTNMNRFDEKVTSAGYGLNSIDLGAFGADTWTTSIGNAYNAFGGTSGATPHVSGTIGLLYSVPCDGFISLAKAAPAAAALLMKQVILDGTDTNESLNNITVTGGRLNVNNSLLLLMENCNGCFPPVTLSANNIGISNANINWAQSDSILRVDARWKKTEEVLWTELSEVSLPLALTALDLCTDYEIQLKGFCQSDTLEYTPSFFFRTGGCCEPPAVIEITEITESSVSLVWNEVLSATGYIIEYRPPGAATWFSSQAFNNAMVLSGLENCTEYEYRIRTHCSSDGENGEIRTFMTSGCGECADTPYCIPEALNGNSEWIAYFSLGSLENTSGNNESYGNFTLLESTELKQGQSYEMSITPAYSGFAYSEDAHIYIDYDHDGEFEEDELFYETEQTFNSNFSTTVEIPLDAPAGLTRMRIVMQFQSVDGPCPGGFQEYGEVEDYCIIITLPDAVEEIEPLNHWEVVPNPFSDLIGLKMDFKTPMEFFTIKVHDSTGREFYRKVQGQTGAGQQFFELNLEQLPPGLYFISIHDGAGNNAVKKVVKI